MLISGLPHYTPFAYWRRPQLRWRHPHPRTVDKFGVSRVWEKSVSRPFSGEGSINIYIMRYSWFQAAVDTPEYYNYYYYYRMGGLTQEWRVIWKFSFWSIFTFKTLFCPTVRRRTAWRARFQGARPNEREERGASPRSRPSPALLRCRASESEVSGALRDGAKDLTRRNFFSTHFQTLSDQKFQEQPGGQVWKCSPRSGVITTTWNPEYNIREWFSLCFYLCYGFFWAWHASGYV